MKDYNRKPYIEGKRGDYREMMTQPTDKAMFDQRLEKQSEFKKPYLEDDYQAMEHFYPPPFPHLDWNFPEFKGPVPSGGEWDRQGIGFGRGCALTCHSPLYCDGTVECHPNIFQHIAEGNEKYAELKWKAYVNGSRYLDTDHLSTLRPFIINAPSGGWAVWPDSQMDKVVVIMVDGAGNVCETKLDVFCLPGGCCPASTTFEWNTGSNPTTIASGGSADIYVQGGCPPYTYTVSGAGATWNSGGGTVLVSSNLNEQLDLADGTCGVDYGAVITVSVVDDCDTSTGSLVLRATGDDGNAPGWVFVSALDDGTGAGCTCANCSAGTVVADGADGYKICAGYDLYWNTYGGACQATFPDPYNACCPNNEVGVWVNGNLDLAVECLATIMANPSCCGEEEYPAVCYWINSATCSATVYTHYTPRRVEIYAWGCT